MSLPGWVAQWLERRSCIGGFESWSGHFSALEPPGHVFGSCSFALVQPRSHLLAWATLNAETHDTILMGNRVTFGPKYGDIRTDRGKKNQVVSHLPSSTARHRQERCLQPTNVCIM